MSRIFGILIFLAALAMPFTGLIAGDEDGGTVSPFTLGAGGRNIAMGGTRSAVWEGSYSLLWNPAGLYVIDRAELDLFHTPLLDESSSYSSALGSYPLLDIGVISFGVLQLSTGGIERRDEGNLVYGTELTNKQTRYVLGFGREIAGGLAGGLSLKLDRFVQGEYSASGFGMDIGFGISGDVENPLIDGAAAGLTFFNILEPKFILESEESGDSYGVRGGLALWRDLPGSLKDRMMIAIDIEKSKYSETDLHVGAEYLINDILAIRGGYDAGFPTMGLGVYLYSFQVDYAFQNTDLENCHLFSVSWSFGPSMKERIDRRQIKRAEEIRIELEKQTSKYETDRISNLLEKAREAEEGQKFDAAQSYFETVLMWEPDDSMAIEGSRRTGSLEQIREADSLFSKGSYGEAILMYRRGNEYLGMSDVTERIAQCEQLLEKTADRQAQVAGVFTHALELYTERKWKEASAAFEEVLELDPDHHISAGYLEKSRERQRQRYEGMIVDIRDLMAKGRYNEATISIRSGLEDHPDDKALNALLEETDRLKERARLARQKDLKPAASISKEEIERLRPVYEAGVEAFRNRKFDQAIEAWESVWSSYRGFEKVEQYLIKAYQYKGMELYTGHDYQQALEVWSKILAVDPDNEKAGRYIRRTREELEKLERVKG